ncbi:MAG: redoxin domain-containing protein, partial [Candidatus Hydrogenedentes bacterium]|nr:redoxin domain-containing protein [Candidatus Hydrogenedentota bacterium]
VLYIQGNGCPIVRQSYPTLTELKKAFAPQGVEFLLINANAQDTREEVAAELKEFEAEFPVLMDTAQTVASGLGVKRTAEAFVIVPAREWKIVYRGALDDQLDYGGGKEAAEHHWLRDALSAVLEERPVETARTEPKGCLINFLAPEKISYAEDIAPIIANRCVSCHEEGGIAPFAFSSHRKAQGWASMIREVVLTRRMPPWHADPHVNSFSNDRGLTPKEEATLLAWIERGAEQDGDRDPLAEPTVAEAAWPLGAPDLVVQLPEEQKLPAKGIVEYQYIYVPSGLTENKWVKGIDVEPSNLEVVHHALIFVVYPEEYAHIQPEVKSGLQGYFAAYLPGAAVRFFPEDTGLFLPAGSTFIFQMHYDTTGKEEVDQTRMALYFHDAPPAQELRITAAFYNDFVIPPGEQDYATEADREIHQDTTVWGLSPHMHYRGGRFAFTAQYPDDRRETLLSVPFYEFDWQPMYMFEKPVVLPAGSRMLCEGAFDNSRYNRLNPDPKQYVRFGEQSFEEMFIGYMMTSRPRDDERLQPREAPEGAALTAESLPGTQWRIGRRIVLRFDADGTVWGNDYLKGSWKAEGPVIHIDSPSFKLELLMDGDDLVFRGRRLDRVEGEDGGTTPESRQG